MEQKQKTTGNQERQQKRKLNYYTRMRAMVGRKKLAILKEIKDQNAPDGFENVILTNMYLACRIREAELIRQWPKRPGEEKEAVGDYELKPDDRITLGVINGRITDVICDKRSRTDVTELTEVNSRTRAIIEIAKDRGVTLPLVNEDWQIIHPTDDTATKFELNY